MPRKSVWTSWRSRRDSQPPVCKFLDYGKFRFDSAGRKPPRQRKKQKDRRGQGSQAFAPGSIRNDYETKMKNVRRFFEEGDKVKITLRFRGREMAHQNLGLKLLLKVKEETKEIAKVELEPQLEGRQMIMILSPR